jgi:tRNA(Ile)-lysidine synthase
MTQQHMTQQHQEILSQCRFPAPATPVDCAVSGGPDSLALLVLAAAAGCRVTAWHVDHGLRPGGSDEAAVVVAAAARVGAEVRTVQIDLVPGPNLEARARQARYAALPPEVLTGHTADDQAETLLLALLRGSGLDGLAAMRPDGRRPLLSLRRWQTEEVCRVEGLDPVRDPTNDDPMFRRNRVRHELLPLAASIAQRDLVPVLARTAAVLRVDAETLEALADGLDPTDAKGLVSAPLGVARRALRRWLADASGGYPPDSAGLDRVMEVVTGQVRACEVAGVGRVSRSRGRLRLEQPSSGGA